MSVSSVLLLKITLSSVDATWLELITGENIVDNMDRHSVLCILRLLLMASKCKVFLSHPLSS